MTNEKNDGGTRLTADAAVSVSASDQRPHAAPTPGPWRWFTGLSDGEPDRTGYKVRYLVGANGQGFAHTVGLDPSEDVANADLIAAAPDLLAFAKRMARSHQPSGPRERCLACGLDGNCCGTYREAAAAIAKAEGR